MWGTTWHGAFENDGFRRAFLQDVAARTRPGWAPAPDASSFAVQRVAMLDRLADAVEDHLDTRALEELIGS